MEFDPGPPSSIAEVFARVPTPRSIGPITGSPRDRSSNRGRRDDSVGPFFVASDPGPTERIAGRTLVGDAGQRVLPQNPCRKFQTFAHPSINIRGRQRRFGVHGVRRLSAWWPQVLKTIGGGASVLVRTQVLPPCSCGFARLSPRRAGA
jgi:hypothetical protein